MKLWLIRNKHVSLENSLKIHFLLCAWVMIIRWRLSIKAIDISVWQYTSLSLKQQPLLRQCTLCLSNDYYKMKMSNEYLCHKGDWYFSLIIHTLLSLKQQTLFLFWDRKWYFSACTFIFQKLRQTPLVTQWCWFCRCCSTRQCTPCKVHHVKYTM